MFTILLGVLCHGGACMFVIWGGLHVVALVLHRAWSRRRDVLPDVRDMEKHSLPAGPRSVAGWFSWLLTVHWVCIAWIFFRAVDLPHAAHALRSVLFLPSAGAHDLGAWMRWVVVALGFVDCLN